MQTPQIRKRKPVSALLDPKIVMPAIGSAFLKLDPRTLITNPVMFVLEIVTALTTVILIRDLVMGTDQSIAFEVYSVPRHSRNAAITIMAMKMVPRPTMMW